MIRHILYHRNRISTRHSIILLLFGLVIVFATACGVSSTQLSSSTRASPTIPLPISTNTPHISTAPSTETTLQIPPNTSENISSIADSGLTDDESLEIQLQSRQFTPETDVEMGLGVLQSASTERVHILVQFFTPPDTTTIEKLKNSGVILLNSVPQNAWFVSVPSTLQVDDPIMPLIRWMGPILPEDKLSSQLLQGTIGPWALRDNDMVALDISVFEDVDLAMGERIVLKNGGYVVNSTPLSNKLTIEAPKEVIISLSQEDIVRWIDLVPPPPTIDQEEE